MRICLKICCCADDFSVDAMFLFCHYVKKVSLLENKEEVGDTDRIVTIRFSNLWEMKWHKKAE